MIKIKIDGQVVHIPTLKGADGKSAYQYAVEAGFKGTEQEFINLLIQGTDVINYHLTDTDAHSDIRQLINSLQMDVNNIKFATKADLDAMQAEIDSASAITSLIRPLSEITEYGVQWSKNMIAGIIDMGVNIDLNSTISIPLNVLFAYDIEANPQLNIRFNNNYISTFSIVSQLINIYNTGNAVIVTSGRDYLKINYNENGEYVSHVKYYTPYSTDVLTKENEEEYIPTSDYNPATKKYVDDNISTHTHDDRYYTESEIDSKISDLNFSIDGKADAKHEHTVSEISDLATYEFITTADIDAICGSSIVAAREEGVMF